MSYAVTVGEPSIPGQVAFLAGRANAGADWVILQPPAIKGTSAGDLMRFFGAVADAIDIGVAVQNNPVNLDVSLCVDALVELNRDASQHPHPQGRGLVSVDIARVIDGDRTAPIAVFGGHGGIEFPALLRSGGAGLIPAPDFLPRRSRSTRPGGRASGTRPRRSTARLLPAIVFMSRSVPAMLCYGKRLMAETLGAARSTTAPRPWRRRRSVWPSCAGHIAEIDGAVAATVMTGIDSASTGAARACASRASWRGVAPWTCGEGEDRCLRSDRGGAAGSRGRSGSVSRLAARQTPS